MFNVGFKNIFDKERSLKPKKNITRNKGFKITEQHYKSVFCFPSTIQSKCISLINHFSLSEYLGHSEYLVTTYK